MIVLAMIASTLSIAPIPNLYPNTEIVASINAINMLVNMNLSLIY